MNKVLKQVFCLFMAAAYVLGYAGFGVHTCHDDGSRHFVWMLGEVSCEEIHHHSHGSDHDHHHDDHCCSTQVYVLTDAQDSNSGIIYVLVSEPAVSAAVETLAAAPVSSVHTSAFTENSPPPKLLLTQSILSVWRV